MKITFCGAAETVTGSCHLVESHGLRVLLDCGLSQGAREPQNRKPFPFDAREIDAVILSHAHLDHAGLLPRLVREGFAGPIYATRPTAEIARLMLADSAHLQMEDAAYHARRARRRGEEPLPALYDMDDVLRCVERFQALDGYGRVVPLGKGVEFLLHDAGHILGSASIELRDGETVLLFSGDLGNRHRPIVRDPAVPPHADAVLVESTYGNRLHRSLDETVNELRQAVEVVISEGGNLIIPSFALERTQEVLYELFSLWERQELPRCEIVVDSPLAASTTRVFARFPDYFDPEGQAVFARHPHPFDFPPLWITQTVDESRRLNELPGGHVILAGSGMCTGGRVVHHLRHNLWRDAAGVLFVGYQAAGTLGRRIVDGASAVRIFGEEVAVRARIWTVNGFSSHADQAGLLDWLGHARPKHVFLVHGEADQLSVFAKKIAETLSVSPHIAGLGETVAI
ncbi:MAG: MBL fold metallo-hydrolase [Candidatus Bipolaricaulota bacterium]